MKYEIMPSLLAAKDPQEALDMLSSHVDSVHIDVMDGILVEQKRFGLDEVTGLETDLRKVFHLMVVDPDDIVADYALAGADTIIIHTESEGDKQEILKKIRDENCRPGISLSPSTPLENAKSMISDAEVVLVMTVEPGKGGQELMPEMIDRVKEIRKIGNDIDIMVDGGINRDNIHSLKEAGANKFVVGTGIFNAENPLKEIEELKRKII